MSLFWTHHAAAGAFTGKAKPFVTFSPRSANSIEFPACSCTDPRAHSCQQHLKHCQADTDLVAKGCFLSLVPSAQTQHQLVPRGQCLSMVLAIPGRARMQELT